jgi:23S rRNA pseudouridine1911/1915/1917 synthase
VGGGGEVATGERDLTAGPDDAGLRLDAFLAAQGAFASRAAAQRAIEDGLVSVNGAARAKNYRVEDGDGIAVAPVPAAAPAETPVASLDVVFEDDDVMVVDKPAGLVTHPAPGHHGTTLAELLPPGSRVVHRLDKDTSGLLLVARTEDALDELQRQMKAREITREYTALVEGHPDAERGTIDAPIGRDRGSRTMMSTRTDKPREAVTRFEIEQDLPRTTLLRVRLVTGRTHQIRAHLAAIGYPVCGDPVYGGAKCGKRLGLTRQFLHAANLRFRHPRTGELVDCESKLPADLLRSLEVAQREPVSGGPDGD